MPARPTFKLLRNALVGIVFAASVASSLRCGSEGPAGEMGSGGSGSVGGPSDAAAGGGGAQDVASVPPGTRCDRCPSYAGPMPLAVLPAALDELSGLAASRRHPGVLYAHNDSANTTVFFALDEGGRLVAEVRLAGADSEDLEAIAIGPCPAAASCIYLGDIGDNDRERVEYAVYVVPEPESLSASPVEVSATRFPFVYPDGPHNAETLVVEARSGRIFVVTKGGEAVAYELPTPLVSGGPATLRRIGALPLPSAEPVTDGSFHPCGERLLVRTMDALYELVRPSGGGLEVVFSASPIPLPLPVEVKGEAVTYAHDGARYFSSGEAVGGEAPPALSMVACAGTP